MRHGTQIEDWHSLSNKKMDHNIQSNPTKSMLPIANLSHTTKSKLILNVWWVTFNWSQSIAAIGAGIIFWSIFVLPKWNCSISTPWHHEVTSVTSQVHSVYCTQSSCLDVLHINIRNSHQSHIYCLNYEAGFKRHHPTLRSMMGLGNMCTEPLVQAKMRTT